MCHVDILFFFQKRTLQLTSGSIGNSSTSTSSSCTVDKIQIFHFSHSFLSVNFTIQYNTCQYSYLRLPSFDSEQRAPTELNTRKNIHITKNIIVTKGPSIVTFESTQQEHEDHTGEYLPKVVVVWTKCSKVSTKMTKGHSLFSSVVN